MGESKRRKQKMGDSYGNKFSYFPKNSNKFSQHFTKFNQNWFDKIKGELSVNSTILKEQKENWKISLNKYLDKYEDENKVDLVSSLILNLCQELKEKLQEKPEPDDILMFSYSFLYLNSCIKFLVFYQIAYHYFSENFLSSLNQSIIELVIPVFSFDISGLVEEYGQDFHTQNDYKEDDKDENDYEQDDYEENEEDEEYNPFMNDYKVIMFSRKNLKKLLAEIPGLSLEKYLS